MDEEIFQDETILALQGRHLDPITALKQAKDIFKCSGAIPPLVLALFRLVWFTGRGRHYHNWTYIRFGFPVPEQLCTHNLGSTSIYKGPWDFGQAVYETEPTAIRLRSRWSPPLFYVHFPILLNFLCLLSLFCWFLSNFAFIKLFYFWNSCRFETWSDSVVVLSSGILLIFRTDRCQFSRFDHEFKKIQPEKGISLLRAGRCLFSQISHYKKWLQKGSNFKINFMVQGWLFLGASLDRLVILYVLSKYQAKDLAVGNIYANWLMSIQIFESDLLTHSVQLVVLSRLQVSF